MDEVNQAIEKLEQAKALIRKSGAIAPEGVIIDTHHPGSHTTQVSR